MSPKHFYKTLLFAQRLKFYRERANITRSEMAKHLNITTTAYGAYELGNREPKLSALCDIADILDVSTDELLGTVPHQEQEYKQFLQDGGFKILTVDGKYIVTDNSCPTTSFTLTLDELRQCIEKVKSSQLYELSLKEWLIASMATISLYYDFKKMIADNKKAFSAEKYQEIEKDLERCAYSGNIFTLAKNTITSKDMQKRIDTAYKKALNVKDDTEKKAPDNT